MKFYLILDPTSSFLKEKRCISSYASFAAVGTWTPGVVCPDCTSGTSFRVEPLLIEWERDSDVIGDFSWSSYTSAVTPRVVRFFRNSEFECEFRTAEVVAPTEKLRKSDVRVPFPYTGPRLKWLLPSKVIRLNEQLSGVRTESECVTCGQLHKTFRYEGIVIDREEIAGTLVFRIASNGRSAAMFATASAKEKIEQQQFTNIAFREAGFVQ